MTTPFDRLNHVEEIMLAKVQQRTPQRMNEDTFLMKTFRYYDLGGTGFVNFDMFEKALSPFSSGITYEDLTAVFQRYASGGSSPNQPALNYKAFAVEFVSGERRRPDLTPPEDDAGAGLDESCNETFLRVRDCLYSRGPRGVMSLAAAFREADPQNTRCLSYAAFEDVMTNAFANESCPLREDQIDMLFDAFRQPYNPEELAYDELFLALLVEQSQERRDVVRAAFRRLDTTSEGLVDMAHVVRSYNVSRHPQVSDGSKSAEEMLNEFADTLSDAVAFRRGQRSYPTNLVAWEEFEDYYKLVNGCFTTDASFCSILQKVWDLDKMPNTAIDARAVLARPAAGVPAKSRVGLHHWQANTLPSNVTHHNVDKSINVGDVLHRVRRQIAQNGLKSAMNVVENFCAVDDDMDDLVDVYEFREACNRSNFTLRDAEEVAIFEECNMDESRGSSQEGGKMNVQQFLRLLQGPMSNLRQEAVRTAWQAIGGGDIEAVISPAQLKDSFNAEAHPLVARGQLEPGEALSEFLSTFSLLAHLRGGCQDGGVAFSDFLAYYEVVSSTVDNDAYFELLLQRLWQPGAVDMTSAPSGPPFAKSRRSPLADHRPPPHSGPSAYWRAEGTNSPDREETHRRFMRKDGPGDVEQPPVPGYSPITKSSIVFDDHDSGELGAVMRRLRESIRKRGIKGWKNLAQRFQQNDHRGNGTVMRLDWERLHRTLGLGLSSEEQQILFKGFSATRRDGAMNYRDCLRSLCGPTSEKRQVLVDRLFDVLADGQDVVPAETLKAEFDARNAPPCLLGLMSEKQMCSDFWDAVDFFGGNCGYDADRFAEFFQLFSALHPEEDEFRFMTTAAFGLSVGGTSCQGGA